MSEVEAEGVKLRLTDTRVYQPAKQPASPRTVHEAFAREFGIAVPGDDEDEEQPS